MVKTLTTTGNSTALVLDRYLLDSIKAVPGSKVRVEVDGEKIVVTRATSEEIAEEAKFRRALDRTTKKFSKAFKRLAEEVAIIHLRRARIIVIHDHQLALYGGLHGIRDEGLLESALAAPMTDVFGYAVYPDLPSMAAAYLFFLAKNHPFNDGNKRTALQTALVFLDMNGMELCVEEDDVADVVIAVCENRVSKDDLVAYFRTNCKSAGCDA